jgi:predicted Zn-ribbon and HTH transcriptional regulator
MRKRRAHPPESPEYIFFLSGQGMKLAAHLQAAILEEKKYAFCDMSTIRQQIVDLLSEQEMNARDLSQSLSIMEKEVYSHLEHIDRTIARQKKKLLVVPFECLSCGFKFDARKKWSKPGRCPVCKKGHIRQALYRIVPV